MEAELTKTLPQQSITQLFHNVLCKASAEAISLCVQSGGMLCAVPLLDPDGIDAAMTRRLLEEHGLAASASLVSQQLNAALRGRTAFVTTRAKKRSCSTHCMQTD